MQTNSLQNKVVVKKCWFTLTCNLIKSKLIKLTHFTTCQNPLKFVFCDVFYMNQSEIGLQMYENSWLPQKTYVYEQLPDNQ